jgi:tRNA pseudouridine55 synthase
VIEKIQRLLCETYRVKKSQLPKMGHGGTLDPFADGLLVVCVGKGVKLSRYFLGSKKHYEATIRFGETTIPGDPTEPISETTPILPESLDGLKTVAHQMTLQPYLQTPPMHSAKKKNGKPLYELARQGIEIDREPQECQLHRFDVISYDKPRAKIQVDCSSGTYIRTLAQDFAKKMGTLALLETLHRSGSGSFQIHQSLGLEEILSTISSGSDLSQLSCFIPFDHLMNGYPKVEATTEEALALQNGQQQVLLPLLHPTRLHAETENSSAEISVIYCKSQLIAIARKISNQWELERVFTRQ